ncbi:MmcB family DNA repair protein [Granulibacter bethesdensis]|uniref:MmcB family DNA repair protein n=1 Tax=Granulibacter bethesdensis TaxID=364410 RepID=UPI00090A96D2|nr:MmcB family DNA repair protein [Granulibacter bethesdensis]APH60386.1 Hypothetical protein GbCGDNIH7_2049 [Granulibacter bethesdensis]
MELSFPLRAAHIRRQLGRLCAMMGWAALHEVPLPNGRRADVLALRGDGSFVCIEIKSGSRDFMTDRKWREYDAYADALFFAVDLDFPLSLLPDDVGIIVADSHGAEIIRPAQEGKAMAPARRRSLTLTYARLAAGRLAAALDPDLRSSLMAAHLVE